MVTPRKPRVTRTAIRRPASGIPIDPAKLLRMRNERAWSREELAARTGISRDSIAKYENGERSPKPDKLRALCEMLDCEPAELLLKARRRLASWGPG